MRDYPGFCGGSYISLSPSALNERTVNFYVERLELPTGQSQDLLYPSPGVTTLSTATGSPGRAHFAQDGREFAVIGSTFCEISLGGTQTSRGTVAVDQYPATICSNGDGGDQLFITSGNNGYIFNLNTSVFTQVRTGGTRMGGQLDGFFLALDADTSTLYISDANNGLTWDPTQYAQRSIQPDPWIAMKVWDRYIWLFGTETSEVWYNAGTSPFPFRAHPSGLVPYGIAAPFSAEVVAGGVMWVSATKDGMGDVVRAQGFTPDVVSPFAFAASTTGYSSIASAIGDTYEDLGHTFYVLTFPDDGTWIYDATPTLQLPQAMRWTERATWIAENSAYAPWRPLYHAFAFNEHRMLDRNTGALYRLSGRVMTDVDDRPLRRLRRPPALWARQSRLSIPAFQLAIEPGVGLVTGQGSDPRVALRISTDSGKTFGNELTRSAGALGQYGTLVEWLRCGSAKRGFAWQPELVMSDPVPYRILGARVRVKQGPAAQLAA